jgi:hypothetical protein
MRTINGTCTDPVQGPTEIDAHSQVDMGLSDADIADLTRGWLATFTAAQEGILAAGRDDVVAVDRRQRLCRAADVRRRDGRHRPRRGRDAVHCAARAGPRDRVRGRFAGEFLVEVFSELLGEDDLLPFFTLLKCQKNLHAQDQIWKKICEDLRWEFISTT